MNALLPTNDITDFIFIADELCEVDALIVLGTSWIELIEGAKRIYDELMPQHVVLSGRYGVKSGRVMIEHLPEQYREEYETEADMMLAILSGWGVPRERMMLERDSQNTRENIEMSLKTLERQGRAFAGGGATIGICCQSFHARRVKETAGAVADDMGYDNMELLVFPIDTQGISRDSWNESEHGRAKVLGEIARLGEYLGVRCAALL